MSNVAIILNVVLVTFVLVGVVGLLGWGILSDRGARQRRPRAAGDPEPVQITRSRAWRAAA